MKRTIPKPVANTQLDAERLIRGGSACRCIFHHGPIAQRL